MPIEFVCTECGQWMAAEEAEIGLPAACPQCGGNVLVPEESDRILAEGACFYCGEAVDRADLPAGDSEGKPTEPPTCAACRESIAENDYELELEQQQRESYQRFFTLAAIFAVGFILIVLLVKFVNHLRSSGQTPHPTPRLVFGPHAEPGMGAVSPTAWLPAPGGPARAE